MTIYLKVESCGDIDLTFDYWDCECEDNYIHNKEELTCLVCKTVSDEQPDSRVNEVKDFLELQGFSVSLIPGYIYP